MTTNTKLPLIITTGDPAGIGMDIVLMAYAHKDSDRVWLVTACLASLKQRYWQLRQHISLPDYQWVRVDTHGSDLSLDFDLDCRDNPLTLYVIDTPCTTAVVAGKADARHAMMIKQQLDMAHTLAINAQVAAIVTAPLAKSVMIDGGVRLFDGSIFCGHTEYFMQACGCEQVVMMLANEVMRVALVTTHLPLRSVADAITAKAVASTVQISHDELQRKFAIACPKIFVCGLNPHAGERGHLGDEELTVINPVLQAFQDKGMDISLAMPADTLFTKPYLDKADVIIAMYHDQGLAPLKSHGFGKTANITLGLPYIRTSVDHGTAFDLAGTGRADFGSLLYAIHCADKMSLGGV